MKEEESMERTMSFPRPTGANAESPYDRFTAEASDSGDLDDLIFSGEEWHSSER